MTESTFYRTGAVALATLGSIGAAISLGYYVTVWLGWVAFAVGWAPIAMKLISVERHRLDNEQMREKIQRQPAPFVTADEDGHLV